MAEPQQPGAGQRGGQQSRAKERLLLTLNSPDLFSCPAPTQVPLATLIGAAVPSKAGTSLHILPAGA